MWKYRYQSLRRLGALTVAAVLVLGTISVFHEYETAQAADGTQFNDGNIISDAVFFNGAALTAAEVQGFLASKVSSCQSGYTCLRNYVESTTDIPANPMCTAYSGAAGESAASIITKVGIACGISQKVILATLEKEQGLVTSTAPSSSRYAAAMGALCPDTAPCDSAASGFFKQVYTGAYLFKRYTQPAGTGANTAYTSRYDLMYPVGQTSAVLYQVTSQPSCGSKNVFIQNQATHVLYVYTPYTPNAAALANMYGTGDACSAYGNRNFWRNFTDWFGSTQYELSELSGVYAVNSSGGLVLYRGTGRGAWSTPVQVGVGWSSMVSVTSAGDFNNDGKRDVLALDQTGQIWMYPTDGATGWLSPVIIDSGWDARSSLISAGDFDENGTIDLFVRDQLGDLWLLRGNGASGISSRSKVGVGWSSLDQLVGGIDWNGDGHTDILARGSNGDLIAYYGSGSSSWSGSARIGMGWQSFAWISSAGDFDGDGAQDLVAALGDGRLMLYTGNGSGSWKYSAQVGIGWSGMRSVFGFGQSPYVHKTMQPGLGDVNSDGARDVVAWGVAPASSKYVGGAVYSRSLNGDLYVSGVASGSWQTQTLIGSGWNSLAQVLGIGDFTGDGHQEVLTLDPSGTVRFYPTNGSTISGAPTVIATGWSPATLMIDPGDFDGDGRQDLITRDANGDLWLYRAISSNGLGSPSKIGHGWNAFDTIIGVGDWNGDNTTDLLARTPSGALFVYAGNGAGDWKSSQQIGVGWQTLTQLAAVGDWNGDGNTDISGRTSSGNVMVYLGNGAGAWLGALDSGSSLTNEILSGLGSLGQPSNRLAVYLGSGRSSWKAVSSFSGGASIGQNVVVAGDTNGDGQRELVWRTSSGALVSQGYNSGGLVGTPISKASDAGTIDLLVGAGDFNGDGFSDVVGRDSAGNLWLYKGSSGTQFTSRIQIGNGWGGMSSIVGVGDFNGDGKSDLLAQTSNGNLYLYAGNGMSGFVSSALIGNGWGGMDVIFSPGDFSGDGKVDVLARQRSTGALYLFTGNGTGGWAAPASQVGSGWNMFSGIG